MYPRPTWLQRDQIHPLNERHDKVCTHTHLLTEGPDPHAKRERHDKECTQTHLVTEGPDPPAKQRDTTRHAPRPTSLQRDQIHPLNERDTTRHAPRPTSGVLSPTRLSLRVKDGSRRALKAALDDVVGTLVKHVTAARLIRVPSIMAALAGRLEPSVSFGDVQQVLASSRLRREDGFFLRAVHLVNGSLVLAHQVARRPFETRMWL